MKRRKLFFYLAFFGAVSLFSFILGAPKARAEGARALVEKRFWKDSVQTNTFSPGDEVYVSLAVSAPDGLFQKVALVDAIPEEAVPSTVSKLASANSSLCGINSPKIISNVDFTFDDTSNEAIFTSSAGIEITPEPKFFCYKFTLDANQEAKNVVREASVIVYDSLRDNILFGGESNYILIVGAPWGDSTASPPDILAKDSSGTYLAVDSKIEDKLIKNPVRMFGSSDDVDLEKYPSFLYITSTGKGTRGGYLSQTPVKVTDSSGAVNLGSANSYVFYNPLYYIFGNVFSGGSSLSRTFDFSSRNSAISINPDDDGKLSSEASVYGYNFDQNSLIYWDNTNRDKNDQMEQNISKYISDPKKEVVCTLSSNKFTTGSNFNLHAKDCASINGRPNTSEEKLYPAGRVWYYRLGSGDSANFELRSNFKGKGTLIIDFENHPSGTITINKAITATLGLILINGGNVNFASNATDYNGIIFVPGDTNGSTDDGKISFSEGGESMTIKGSLVANKIIFNTRKKNAKGYAVEIYSDAKILSSGLQGFETFSSIVY